MNRFVLGLTFIIVFGSAYILFRQSVEAPSFEGDSSHKATVNQNKTMSLSLTSPVFANGATIPTPYTCDGKNGNPPFVIGGVPEGTKAFALVMDDPDIPAAIKVSRGIEKFNHWALYNIPADTRQIEPNTAVGLLGLNSQSERNYIGPCPPPDMEPFTHRYIFRLYALGEELTFEEPPTLDELETAAKKVALESTELMGVYSRAE